MPKAPGVKCKLIGADSNVFNLMGIVLRELNKAGFTDIAKEYQERCLNATSFDEVLRITMDTVEIE